MSFALPIDVSIAPRLNGLNKPHEIRLDTSNTAVLATQSGQVFVKSK